MAKKIKKQDILENTDGIVREALDVDKFHIGDIVYLDDKDTTSWTILDIGCPFVLILNNLTNFAYMYKTNKLYKNK